MTCQALAVKLQGVLPLRWPPLTALQSLTVRTDTTPAYPLPVPPDQLPRLYREVR